MSNIYCLTSTMNVRVKSLCLHSSRPAALSMMGVNLQKGSRAVCQQHMLPCMQFILCLFCAQMISYTAVVSLTLFIVKLEL